MTTKTASSAVRDPRPPEAGATPRHVVWTRNKTTLYRYEPLGPRVHATPVLIVYALINRPYILDLRPESSLVRRLVENGYDVFLLDWGVPAWEDRETTLDELVGEHLPRAAARMRRAGAGDDYTLMGYCMGGTMATMHAALRPEGLRNLIALTTPVDFSQAGIHALWTDPRHLDVRALVAALGNVPASLIDLGNKLLRPVANYVGVRETMLERIAAGRDMASWNAMNTWVNDGVPFPGAAFVQWIEDHYQGNRLMRDDLALAGRPVLLEAIEMPLLAIAGAHDHLVPPAMARPLVERVSSDDTEYIEIPAGHVGMLVGSGARTTLWPHLVRWLDARSD